MTSPTINCDDDDGGDDGLLIRGNPWFRDDYYEIKPYPCQGSMFLDKELFLLGLPTDTHIYIHIHIYISPVFWDQDRRKTRIKI